MSDLLDFRTLLVVFALTRMFQAIGLIYVWHIDRRYVPARNWAVGSTLIASGAILMALRGQLPFDWAIIASNLLICAGILLFNGGIVQACARKVPWPIGLVFTSVTVLGQSWFTIGIPWVTARVVVLMCFIAAANGYAATSALRTPGGPLRGIHLFIAALLAIQANVSLVYGIAATQAETTSILHSTPAQALFLLSAIAIAFLITVALAILTIRRITVLFEATLRHMNHGVAMFDQDRKLIICNDQYARIYGLAPEQVYPGEPLEQIIDHRVAKGVYANSTPEEYRQERLAPVLEPSKTLQHLHDGRSIAISRQPIDGGGWVTTHEDVTERREVDAKLAESAKELECANARFNAAINNLSQGLALFDSDRRVVFRNDKFATMYGLKSADVRPGMHLNELYDLRIKNGIFAGPSPDRYLSDRVKALNVASVRTDDLSDGRSILITHRPMPDGGWVTTHEDVTERKRAELRIAFNARHDLLTGLANRAFFLERMGEAIGRLRRTGEAFAVLMLDLDRFKSVNDSLGHPAGDALLKETACRLKSALRETDTLARFGGDEFAIIQTEIKDQREGPIVLANRLIEVIGEPYDIDGNTVSIGTSIGIAAAPTDGDDQNELMKKADLALYETKSRGRNGYRLFDAEMARTLSARQRLESELRSALVQGELELHYQPIIDVRTRMPHLAEALVRWRHPQRGLIPAEEFIGLAEETGLIIPLEEWVLRKACTDAAAWPAHIKVAVNLSPAHFRISNLLDVILTALVDSGLSPGRLEVEITETAMLENEVEFLTLMRQLNNIGVTIALDDFGIGFSSLSYLAKFPFDRIKIDKSFVHDLASRTECSAIVSSVVTLGHGLQIPAVAEGVETGEQFELLRAAGVSFVQGFLFGYPCQNADLEFGRVDIDMPFSSATNRTDSHASESGKKATGS